MAWQLNGRFRYDNIALYTEIETNKAANQM